MNLIILHFLIQCIILHCFKICQDYSNNGENWTDNNGNNCAYY